MPETALRRMQTLLQRWDAAIPSSSRTRQTSSMAIASVKSVRKMRFKAQGAPCGPCGPCTFSLPEKTTPVPPLASSTLQAKNLSQSLESLHSSVGRSCASTLRASLYKGFVHGTICGFWDPRSMGGIGIGKTCGFPALCFGFWFPALCFGFWAPRSSNRRFIV